MFTIDMRTSWASNRTAMSSGTLNESIISVSCEFIRPGWGSDDIGFRGALGARGVAEFFARLAPELIIEFVPKGDAKVDTLLATREDIFPDYTREGFERAFGRYFEIVASESIASSDRRLYRMRRRFGPFST